MRSMKRPTAFIAVALAVVGALVATGLSLGGTSSGASTYRAAPGVAAKRAAPTVQARRSSLGKILVDGRGRTLYLFEADRPNVSNCSGGCLTVWPALAAKGAPRAGRGVSAHKLGTIRRRDGRRQVTYARHPLYYYVADARPGDVSGQALDQFGAEWYVLAPSGRKIGD